MKSILKLGGAMILCGLLTPNIGAEQAPEKAADAADYVLKDGQVPKNIRPPELLLLSYGLACDNAVSDDDWVVLKSRLDFDYAIKVYAPAVPDNAGFYQRLDVLNERGEKLTEVVIYTSPLGGRVVKKPDVRINYYHQMNMRGFDPKGAAYLRLKGELKLPLSLLTRGETYEIPVAQGEEILMMPPGMDVPAEDVAVSGEGMDRLFISGTESRIVYDKKFILVELQYFNQVSGLNVDSMELLDEKGAVMDIGINRLSGDPPRFSFLYPAELKDKPLRFRMIYKKFWKDYILPVDFKLDFCGSVIPKNEAK